ncbi:hypothetical protein GLW07_18815 [Bacillus hwajinpoensis]|uniref:DUF4064 domain-containing protein n=1 Tax=Guptibacillus hwajinpoensis TaxID=208199 RepID=A0A845F431_9BACL|nr:hypothetical protein [Pseudalkalibacillus hwajinpoensis]MYL65415.1 hypothetical protein [Pseudalkalibacillus hwajinpoensis]
MTQKRMFKLAVAGCVLGIIAAVLSRFNVIPLIQVKDISFLTAFIFPAFAVLGCYFVKTRPIIGGFSLLVSAAGGIIFLSIFYIIPAAFLVTSGFLSILLKEEPQLVPNK